MEHYLATQLLRLQRRVSSAIAKVLVPRLAKFAKPDEERSDATRLDAPPPPADGDVGATLLAVRKAAQDAIDDHAKELESGTQLAAKRTVKHSQSEFKRIGVNIKKEPNLASLVSGWSKDVAGRFQGMTDDQIDKLGDLLDEGMTMRHETLAREIARQLEGVSESRAEFIARDGLLSLNAKITERRMVAAGVERYVWSTSQDERVRPEHQELEGVEFAWASGGAPGEGHPGEAPMCRCVAFPLLPEIDDE